MTLANIPLAIDGALTGASLLRKGLMAAIGGGGVVSPADLKVSASVPNGQSLQISSGLAAIPNGYQTTPDEVYVEANPNGHAITSADMPSASGSTTYWLVCLVVGDPAYDQTGHPFMPSDFDEAQANTFQYVRPVLLPCSSTTTTFEQLNKHYPGLALARIAIPPSTTTITDAMITDVRTRSGRGQLLSRAAVPNVGAFPQNLSPNTAGNVIYTHDFTVSGGELPSGASKAFIKHTGHAYADGIQQVISYLQYRFNGTGAWTDVDFAYGHNNAKAAGDLGNTLMGNVEIPDGSTALNVRLVYDVGNSTFAVQAMMNNLTVNFFR